MAAEILLQFYEEVAQEAVAEPLPEIPPLVWHPLCDRLRSDVAELDRTLTSFGLSPHPAVVLVVEGETEMLLVPRAMKALGVPQARPFMHIVKARGSDRDLSMLAGAFAGLDLRPFPSTSTEFLLTRPATRILIVSDEENLYS
ncbi:MAG: hypothetical protein ACREQ5_33450, partial [Candidatus Dormibacteria bacterium]